MPRTIETTPRLIATLTLGSNLTAGTEKYVSLKDAQSFLNPGFKSILLRLRLVVQVTGTISAAQPALSSLFLKALVNKRLVGPANYPIVADQPGWQDSLWQYIVRGEVGWKRCRDIAAGTVAFTRTWEQGIDFEEPMLNSQIARAWPLEAFKAPNSGLYVTLRATPIAGGIKGVAGLTITAATIQVFADVFDQPADQVPIPICTTRYSSATNAAELNPSPGIGKYLRMMMANSPIPTDNVDQTFGAGTNTSDDLSTYTTVESFGYTGNQPVNQEPVDQLLQRKVRELSREPHSQLDNNAGNKGEFRLIDPMENFDGLVRLIPLVTPGRNTSVTDGRRFSDFPKLYANAGVRTGLPAGFWWLLERVDPRTDAILNGIVGAMTDVNGRPILGRTAMVPPTYRGADPSIVPLIINAK
jgi:hypothetical protein